MIEKYLPILINHCDGLVERCAAMIVHKNAPYNKEELRRRLLHLRQTIDNIGLEINIYENKKEEEAQKEIWMNR